MSTLLTNLVELVKMIFGVIVTPNYGASSENYNLLRNIYYAVSPSSYPIYMLTALCFIPIAIMCIGGAIGILRRFLWKS